MALVRLALCILLLAQPHITHASPRNWPGTLPFEAFIRQPQVQDIKLSPDGAKLAVLMLEDGRRVLAMMTLKPLEVTYVLRFGEQEHVGEFEWAGPDRVVSTTWQMRGFMDTPVLGNNLFAVDYDGGSPRIVFGFNVGAEVSTGSRVAKQQAHMANAQIIHAMPDDPKHILIRTLPWERRGAQWYSNPRAHGEILRLNIRNGRTRKITNVPVQSGRVFATPDGEPTFAVGTDVSTGLRLTVKRLNGEWTPVNDQADRFFYPVSYSADTKMAYVLTRKDSDTLRLVSHDLDTGRESELFRGAGVDVSDFTHFKGEPVSVHTENGMPEQHYLGGNKAMAAFLRGFEKSFPNYRVTLVDSSADGKIGLLRVDGDNLPGDYFLADLKSKRAEFLLSSADWLPPEALARTTSINFAARDGKKLQGYLTFPPASSKQKLPMIVLPHGGPMSRDYWQYERERQILSQAGYLVLTVNFRGSDGYGLKFMNAGYGNWGAVVQKDIADATRWAIREGYADASRVCIYGASFGAYSAIMNVALEPGLYQCAAGFAGVYDLQMLYERGDIKTFVSGRTYLEKAVGRDEETLRAFSPVHQVDKVKVPVFIAHGGQDKRAPIEHAEALVKALEDLDKTVVTQFYEAGGHGYYSDEANLKLYTGLLNFLAEHLTPGATTVAPSH